jgi:hypothetical protein
MANGRRSREGAAADETGNQIATAVRNEAIGYIAKAVIATAVGVVCLAGLGLWIYVNTLLPEIAGGVPSGAVFAFDRQPPNACPLGWTQFKEATSRVIVGAGNRNDQYEEKFAADDTGRPLTPRAYRQHGGRELYALRIDNLPPHDHALQTARAKNMQGANDYTLDNYVGRDDPETDPKYNRKGYTEKAGSGEPINISNPYIALYYCRKN